jgi:hypothetical protein
LPRTYAFCRLDTEDRDGNGFSGWSDPVSG